MNNRLKRTLFCRVVACVLILVTVFAPCTVYAQEQSNPMAVLVIDDTQYSVELQFWNNVLYCRADQWAQVAGCSWKRNTDNEKLYFYNSTPVIIDSYTSQECRDFDGVAWVPFFRAAKQTGVCFTNVSDGSIYGYRTKPLAVFYHDMDRMFGVSRYRITELVLSMGNLWLVASTAARGYAILSSMSISGFVDAASGKMDQDVYVDIFTDLLKNDETLIGVLSDTEKAITKAGKTINLLQKSIDEGSAVLDIMEKYGFSERELRDFVESAAQGAYGNNITNILSDIYTADKAANLSGILSVLNLVATSVEADTYSVLAMQSVFSGSESKQIKYAAQKAVGKRTGLEAGAVAAGFAVEYIGERAVDWAISEFEKVYEKSKNITNLEKLKADILLNLYDKSLSLTEKSNAILYTEAHSQLQLELASYYYDHRDDATPQNSLLMYAVAQLYLRSCIAAYELYDFDAGISQTIDTALQTLTAELTNLMTYTEESLLQNGTQEDTKQEIVELVKKRDNSNITGPTEYPDSDVEDPEPKVPTQQELFNGTCWRTTLGYIDAVHYEVFKFFGDGTYVGYSLTGISKKFTGTYTYANGVLEFEGDTWDLTDYGSFRSRKVIYQSSPGQNICQELFPGGEAEWNEYAGEEQPANPQIDWHIGVWKHRFVYDGATWLNEVGLSDNGEVHVFDSIENGHTFAILYGEWELVEKNSDYCHIELYLSGTDSKGNSIRHQTRIALEKSGENAYIRHLSGDKTRIYYDKLFVRE